MLWTCEILRLLLPCRYILMFIEGAPFGRVLDRTQNLPQRGALRNGMQIVPSCSRASGVFC